METQVTKLSPKEVIQALQARATSSPVFNAMATVFALRERSRQQITIANLYAVMVKEGFKYDKPAYIRELTFMSSVGIGSLDMDNKKRIRALKNIQVTLQSIGVTALAKGALERQTPTPVFMKLPIIEQPAIQASKLPSETKMEAKYRVTLLISVDGKESAIEFKNKLTAEGLLSIIGFDAKVLK